MLPYLQPHRMAAMITTVRKPSGEGEMKPEQKNPALLAAAEDLIRAVHSKDIPAVADALEAAFQECDSEPHAEGPHTNEGEE